MKTLNIDSIIGDVVQTRARLQSRIDKIDKDLSPSIKKARKAEIMQTEDGVRLNTLRSKLQAVVADATARRQAASNAQQMLLARALNSKDTVSAGTILISSMMAQMDTPTILAAAMQTRDPILVLQAHSTLAARKESHLLKPVVNQFIDAGAIQAAAAEERKALATLLEIDGETLSAIDKLDLGRRCNDLGNLVAADAADLGKHVELIDAWRSEPLGRMEPTPEPEPPPADTGTA